MQTDTIEYDGLTLTVSTVETDLLRGDECVGHGVRVVGIERVKEEPVESVRDVRRTNWLEDLWWETPSAHGYRVRTHTVTNGRALAAWLTEWGGDHLLDYLTERLMARMRDDAERAVEDRSER